MGMHLFQFQRKEFAGTKKTSEGARENLEKIFNLLCGCLVFHTLTRETISRHGEIKIEK